MLAGDVVEVMRRLAVADPLASDAAGLAVLTSAVQHVRSWLDAFDAAVAVRADELTAAGAGRPACVVLTDGGRRSSREIAVVTERAAVCASMPEVHAALAAGSV